MRTVSAMVMNGRERSRWLQFWLQLAAFAVVRGRPGPSISTGQEVHGKTMNRPERDHEGVGGSVTIGSG